MSLFDFNTVYRPDLYPWATKLTQDHESSHWVEEDANLSPDITQFHNVISSFDREVITKDLHLFTQSDVAVAQSYVKNLIPYYNNNSIRCMLLSFAAREGIHQRAYALLNDTLGLPEKEYLAFLEYKEMSAKWDFIISSFSLENEWENLLANLAVKNVLVEGCSLFVSFALLFIFKLEGNMTGTTEIVEWSVRDETLHVHGNSLLFRQSFKELSKKIDHSKLIKFIQNSCYELYEIEMKVIDFIIGNNEFKNLNKDILSNFTKFLIDRRLLQLGIPVIFKQNKLPREMDYISNLIGSGITKNFFEGRVTNYSKKPLSGSYNNFYNTIFK